jgi:endonuclease/exonuclease/phosphatase family metal-dependent hydrolase
MCPSGAWNGSTCTASWDQVIGILSTFPIANSSAIYLPATDCWTSARTALRAAVSVNGTTLQVFNTHLQTGGCADDAASRYHSMSLIKSWAANYSKPQILSGDFNADPDQIDTTQGMLPNFVDTWSLVGSGSKYTALGPNPTMKLDYWFTDASMTAQPQASEVVTSTGSLSDHRPLRTTFLVK